MIRTLFRNFFADSFVMKLIHLWGWLCIVLMICALFNPFYLLLVEPSAAG